MDLLSLSIGFLSGALTGAAGNYLADKFTDARREKKEAKASEKLWKDIELRFPEIIEEMRSDISSPQGKGVRAFFIKESNTVIAFTSEPCFEYHTDKHPELRAAVLYLAQHGFVQDITPGNTPMYRINERLVDFLRNT
ncbi:hypothetical protein ACUTAF_03740 [Pseudomonas sp. SP16.1]|uniref:hypothetical protein n=1 Tax=Pseudomonas sp. SP16.1 TaxID=3458854 RepID=UPI00404576BA